MNALRWNDWKVNFAGIDGNIALGTRKVTSWPLVVNLRAEPRQTSHYAWPLELQDETGQNG